MTLTPEQEYERRGNDYLRDQMAMLRKDRKLLRKLTLLRVECRGCSSVLIEVIATRPWWVLVMHNSESRKTPAGLYDRPAGLTEMEWGRLIWQRRRDAGQDNPIRQSSERSFYPLSRQGPDDGTPQVVRSVCRCQQFERRMTWLYAELERAPKDGRAHIVAVSPPAFTR